MNVAVRAPFEGDLPSATNQPALLEIRRIRRDGDTQGRVSQGHVTIKEYAELMKMGVEFPPVRTWFDGDVYWLSDGFRRLAAAESIGVDKIAATVLCGTVEDARWDSYAANSSHGLRRTGADVAAIVKRALEHPRGSQLSNRDLGRHLSIPEATVRRWRNRLSKPGDGDTIRLVTRRGITYPVQTAKIGKNGGSRRIAPKSLETLRGEFNSIRQLASPRARSVLTIIEHWLFDGAPATVCLNRIEDVTKEWAVPPNGDPATC